MPQKKDLCSEIVDKIKAMILSGELAPGQQIRQEEVAAQLGVSRTPLLQALHILRTEMLVESIPNRGTFVRKISLKELKDLFEYRIAVESMACRLAIENITKDEILQLKALFEPFIKNPQTINFRRYEIADREFHRLVFKFSGNSFFLRMDMLGNVLISVYQRGLIRPPVETLPEHLEIIDAIDKKDADEAATSMTRHLDKSVHLIKQAIQDENQLHQ